MKKLSIQILAVLVVLIFVSRQAWSQKDVHYLHYTVSNTMPEMQWSQGKTVRLIDRKLARNGTPGEPELPVRVARIALPPDAELSTVQIEISPLGVRQLPGSFDVAPVPPKMPIHGGTVYWGPHAKRIQNAKDMFIYGQNALFPQRWGEVELFTGHLRQIPYNTLRLYPIRYNPATKSLKFASDFQVTVSYKKRAAVRAEPKDCTRDELKRSLFLNFDQVKTWYQNGCHPLDDTAKNVAIIITGELRKSSTMLDQYIDLREKQGYQIEVLTEEDWDVSTGALLDGRADRIRHWLKSNYVDKKLGYAILLGNPHPDGNLKYSIPMKHCGIHEDSDLGTVIGPTDFYYADLSGTWDDNNNGTVCEYGEDNVDFTPEIYVGRIPVYSDGADALDDILTRIIAYENESETGKLHWRRRMLLPNSIYFFEAQAGTMGTRWDGASNGEYFVREQLSARGIDWTTLYEVEGLKPSIFESHFPINGPNLVDQWVRGYGLVFWAGHGSNTGVYRTVWEEDPNEDGVVDYREMSSPEFMTTDMLHMLEKAPPPFVIHGSCSNGTPEDPNNLGYSMLRRGAIATLSASRVALAWHFPNDISERWDKMEEWDGCVTDIVTDYTVNLLDGMEAGRALGMTIAKTNDLSESVSWFQKSIQNLYGDPLMRLTMCRADADCSNGLICDGEERCANGACLPGEPLECMPQEDCEQVACVEGRGCVRDESCPPPMDEGTDVAPEDTDEDGVTTAGENAEVGEDLTGFAGCMTLGNNATRRSSISILLRLLM